MPLFRRRHDSPFLAAEAGGPPPSAPPLPISDTHAIGAWATFGFPFGWRKLTPEEVIDRGGIVAGIAANRPDGMNGTITVMVGEDAGGFRTAGELVAHADEVTQDLARPSNLPEVLEKQLIAGPARIWLEREQALRYEMRLVSYGTAFGLERNVTCRDMTVLTVHNAALFFVLMHVLEEHATMYTPVLDTVVATWEWLS